MPLIVLAVFIGISSVASAVIGGRSKNELLIRQSIVALTSGSTMSSGVILSDSAILTAAHNTVSDQTVIRFGFEKDRSRGEARKVSRVIIHPDYDAKNESGIDLKILFFNGGLPEGFKPVVIASNVILSNKAGSEADRSYQTAGFGIYEFEPQTLAGRLMGGEQSQISVTGSEDYIEVDQSSGAGVCSGDSGGPLYQEVGYEKSAHEVRLYGILHATKGYSNHSVCGTTAIYINATKFSEWLSRAAFLNR